MKILVVEDEEPQRRVLTSLVARWGHEVVEASSGEEALCAAATVEFDLCLLDVFLPDTTAMELIPQLRALGAGAPVITLTGKSSRELERRLRELGIAYYMAKPVAAVELKSILDHMERLPRPNGRGRPHPAPAPAILGPAAEKNPDDPRHAGGKRLVQSGKEGPASAAAGENAADGSDEGFAVGRLEDVILVVELGRPQAAFLFLDPRVHDHGDGGRVHVGLQLGKHLEAVLFRHHDVEEDEIGPLPARRLEGLPGVVRHRDRELPVEFELGLLHGTEFAVIVDDEDVTRHPVLAPKKFNSRKIIPALQPLSNLGRRALRAFGEVPEDPSPRRRTSPSLFHPIAAETPRARDEFATQQKFKFKTMSCAPPAALALPFRHLPVGFPPACTNNKFIAVSGGCLSNLGFGTLFGLSPGNDAEAGNKGVAPTLTVLAVEDDAQQRRFLEKLILAGGHRVFAAETAGAALRLVAARTVDLAVLDVFLPDGTALELIPGLRAFRPGLPVVTVTGENSRELELALRRLGIVCYLTKPIRSGEFLGLLDHLNGRLQRDDGGEKVSA